jgi:hypothetical protein
MINFIDIYIFILVSSHVGRGPSELLCLGAYNAVKTILECHTIPLIVLKLLYFFATNNEFIKILLLFLLYFN